MLTNVKWNVLGKCKNADNIPAHCTPSQPSCGYFCFPSKLYFGLEFSLLKSELNTWCVRTDNRMVEMWRTLQHMSQPWPWPLLMRCGLWYSHYLIEHSARVTSFVLNHYLHRHVFICFTQVICNRYLYYQFDFPIMPRICIKEVRWLLTLGW